MVNIDQQIAQLKSVARGRRDLDVGATLLVAALCVTVAVPWGIGRFSRGWLREPAAAVYDGRARQTGTYFLTDWWFGCCVLLALLAAFLVLRPWSHRIKSVVLGAVIAAGVGLVLWPACLAKWESAEAKTVEVLRTTEFPWWEDKFTCGYQTWKGADGTLWQAHTGRYVGAEGEDCDFVVVYKGWEEFGREDVPDNVVTRYGGVSDDDMNFVIGRHGEVRFSVTAPSGRSVVLMRFPIGRPENRSALD